MIFVSSGMLPAIIRAVSPSGLLYFKTINSLNELTDSFFIRFILPAEEPTMGLLPDLFSKTPFIVDLFIVG